MYARYLYVDVYVCVFVCVCVCVCNIPYPHHNHLLLFYVFLFSSPPSSLLHTHTHTGPRAFVSDMGKEFTVLQTVWQHAVLFLCTFHLLQMVWRWLSKPTHGIPRPRQVPLLGAFKRLLYFSNKEADVPTAFAEAKDNFLAQDIVVESPAFAHAYLGQRLGFFKPGMSKHVFTCFRHDVCDRGQETNNVCEGPNRMIKEDVLGRVKAWNVVHLCYIVTEKLEDHLCNRILGLADKKTDKKQIYIQFKVRTDRRINRASNKAIQQATVNEAREERQEGEGEENRDVVDTLHKRSLLLRRLQLSISRKSKECKCYLRMLQRL